MVSVATVTVALTMAQTQAKLIMTMRHNYLTQIRKSETDGLTLQPPETPCSSTNCLGISHVPLLQILHVGIKRMKTEGILD